MFLINTGICFFNLKRKRRRGMVLGLRYVVTGFENRTPIVPTILGTPWFLHDLSVEPSPVLALG